MQLGVLFIVCLRLNLAMDAGALKRGRVCMHNIMVCFAGPGTVITIADLPLIKFMHDLQLYTHIACS